MSERFEELLSRWENGIATAEDLREIDGLLHASAGHRKTFLERALLEVDLHETYSGEIAEAVRQSPRPRLKAAGGGRLAVAWAAGLLLAVVGGTILLRSGPGRAPAGAVQVTGSQPRVFELEDGSRVELRPGADATFRGGVDDARQVVELRQGSGRFEVQKGTGAFQVRTPLGWVTASEADFEVAIPRPGGLAVSVTRGQVEAAHGESRRVLDAGERHVFETVTPRRPRPETPVQGKPPEEKRR